MGKLPTNLYGKLFKKPKKHGQSDRRRLTSCIQVFDVGRIGNFDALAAIILLMRETELRWKPDLYIDTKWEVINLITRMATLDSAEDFWHRIYQTIHQEFILKNNPLPEKYKMTMEFYDGVTWDHPPIYTSPPHIDLDAATAHNFNYLLRARIHNCVSSSRDDWLDYLWLCQQRTKRNLIESWSVENSRPSSTDQNDQPPPTRPNNQLHHYMQLIACLLGRHSMDC